MYPTGYGDYQNYDQNGYNSTGTAEGDYAELNTLIIDGGHSYGACRLKFDNQQELLWAGSESGHLTSYFSSQLQKYTSFQVHPVNNPVRDIFSTNDGILSLARDRVTFSQRGGLTNWTAFPDGLTNATSIHAQRDTSVLVGGICDQIFELDITNRGKIMRTVPTGCSGITLFRTSQSNSRYLYTADDQGNIHCRDPSSLHIQHTLPSPFGTIMDFDVCSNLLVTCGMSHQSAQSRLGHVRPVQNRFVQIYDLRMMKAAAPLQPKFDPRFLKFIPTFTSRLLIMSTNGDLVIVEPSDIIPPSAQYYKLDTMGGTFQDVALSSSTQAIAFGTSSGLIHVWSSRQQPSFNHLSCETEWPTIDTNYPSIPMTDETTPFSIIPNPFLPPGEKLLSDWPSELIQRKSYRPRPIDPQILATMNVIEGVGYAPKPPNMKKPQLPYIMPDYIGEFGQIIENPNGERIVPVFYRPVEMTFAHLPIEERQAEILKYNVTNFVGLEPHIPNTYCNNMLQMFYMIRPLRAALQSHSSMRETDLAAELGFLFHLLDNQKGGSAPASNFLRSFRVSPQATALRLVLNNGAGSADVARRHGNLGRLIQSWNRFMLQRMHTDTEKRDDENETDDERRTRKASESQESSRSISESNDESAPKSIAQQFFETRLKVSTKFKSGHTSASFSSAFLFNIDWHHWINNSISEENWKNLRLCFADIIKRSIWSEMYTKSWCDETQSYQMGQQIRQPLNLPDILVLNCNLESNRNEDLWRIQTELAQKDNDTWIPFEIKYRFYAKGSIKTIKDGKTPPDETEGEEYEDITYKLHGTVIFVQEPGNPIGNLVSHINVGDYYHKLKNYGSYPQWYLFNDLWIQKIDKKQAVNFNLAFATPCVLYFVRCDLDERHATDIVFPLDESVLLPMKSVSKIKNEIKLFTSLDDTETPKKGTLIAIDCEFVTLNAEETELRSDGTNAVVRPSHSAVARVTAIRGDGENEGLPFIDDYIATSEQVVDYLTKFSGIQPGDLDAAISSKYLATLKTSYCKLRYLAHLGVKFIGHGLSKDFTELNLHVRPEQIIDTVTIFHLPRKRLVSLRFLAWYFLKKRIQGDVHDSIEDARTALQLYKKYMEITANGRKTQEFRLTILRALYDEGNKQDWKVPEQSIEDIKNIQLE